MLVNEIPFPFLLNCWYLLWHQVNCTFTFKHDKYSRTIRKNVFVCKSYVSLPPPPPSSSFPVKNLTECQTSVRRCCYITLALACLLRQACTALDSPSYPEKKPHFKQAKKKKGVEGLLGTRREKNHCAFCLFELRTQQKQQQQDQTAVKKGGIYIGMREFNNLC